MSLVRESDLGHEKGNLMSQNLSDRNLPQTLLRSQRETPEADIIEDVELKKLLSMKTPICLLQSALGELFARVNRSGYITKADRFGLQAAIMDESLEEEEMRCINRLLRSLRRGRLKIVDEISALA